ncbi:NAD kinase [Marinilabiliaceae bacterium JC017]|nr:NAD kinase [Marinilabiliaceae bacterium JC017]
MKVAIFGKRFGDVFFDSCVKLFRCLEENKVEIIIYRPFYDFLLQTVKIKPKIGGFFERPGEINGVDLVFSIGGDGTFLETVTFVQDTGIPIVGINSGRLGFLADISKEEIEGALMDILNKRFSIRELDLLSLHASDHLFGDLNFALNELAITKRDSSSMITIHTYLNDEFLNSYWADGLIIATPTGSTAYSLSVGGPIMHPDSHSFIITPIAPHNLTVRPMVVPNDVEITLKVEGRGGNFLAALDSRSEFFEEDLEIKVKRANFKINVIVRQHYSFYKTLRNKLMWGMDKRNY